MLERGRGRLGRDEAYRRMCGGKLDSLQMTERDTMPWKKVPRYLRNGQLLPGITPCSQLLLTR